MHNTSIPVSFYLSPQPLSSSPPPAQQSEFSAQSCAVQDVNNRPQSEMVVDSDTIVLDTSRSHIPPVSRNFTAPRHIQRAFGATEPSRKRRAETVWARGAKRPAQTRIEAIPLSVVPTPQTVNAMRDSAPLTPPSTPPAFVVNMGSTAQQPIRPEQPCSQVPATLPPTSIVTTRNRMTQEFRNGITSVQVRSVPARQPAAESGLISRELQNQRERSRNPTQPIHPPPTEAPQAPATSPQAQETSETQYSTQETPKESQATLNTTLEGCVQPAVNWDCHTHVVQDQKIYTTYEKPSASPTSSTATSQPQRPQSYNKMTTKTVTITITTTIATTEILRPGEPGYEESLQRHRDQTLMSEQEKERMRKEYNESRLWASGQGSRRLNEQKHWKYHKAAEPGKMPVPGQFQCQQGEVKAEPTEGEADPEPELVEKVVVVKQEIQEEDGMGL